MKAQTGRPKAGEAARLLHIITGLSADGAQTMLYRLLAAADRTLFTPEVISLMDRGTMGESIERLGVRVSALRISPESPRTFVPAIPRLARHLMQSRPRVVQGWMYHANLLASLSPGLACRRMPVAWNIRQALYPAQREKPLTAFVLRVGRWLSPLPACIIYNSRVSAGQHEQLGFCTRRAVVIPNGFDTALFAPRPDAGDRLRFTLGFKNGGILIGMIGRYHPMKDHATFVRAAAAFSARRPDSGFVLAGAGVTSANDELTAALRQAGLAGKVHLLGERGDVAEIMAGLDIATSSSFSEAFPNAIGEAMATGVPCVVTDVGDSARLVGDAGIVVAPRDPQALADGWEKVASMASSTRKRLGEAARQRILDHFSLKAVSAMYEDLYLSLIETLPCAD